MYRLFVSYSSRDEAPAVALSRWLVESEPSLRGEIFLDVDPQTGIAPGTRWKSELVRAVDQCEAVICLISANWEASVECGAEFRLAESLNKRIYCARLDATAIGERARDWQFCDLFPDGDGAVTTIECDRDNHVDFSTDGLNRLLRGLRDAGIGAEHFPWPPPGDADRAPYRGWQPMEDVDAAVFFGRDPQILRGLDTLRGMRTTGVEGLFVILGPSGVGKSSFLRAGLLPRLNRDRRNFVVADIVRPERVPLTGEQGLARSIWQLRLRARIANPALGDIKTACLAGDGAQVRTWLREAVSDDVSGEIPTPTVVLPIDQGEELFTADAGLEATTCLALLGDLLQSRSVEGSSFIAVVTIRADHYESLQTAPELHDVHARQFGDLKPMPLTEFKEVITGPAERAAAAGLRLRLEPSLVAQLLADATGGADSLPLLALALSRLYLDYGTNEQLQLANYRAMGGMQRIVNAEIDTLLAVEPEARAEQMQTLRAAFIPWLATVDPDTDLVSRRIARWTELPAASHELIDAMVSRRLLVKDERDGETVVEVALESLFRQWDSLAEWLGEQAEDLKAADKLDRAAADWERSGRGPEWLIGGVRLAAAEKLANSSGFGERLRYTSEFLRASREGEDAEAAAELRNAQQRRDEAEAHAAALRKRARILRAVLALTLVVALVAVGGWVYAAKNGQEADQRSREALAERLTSQAQSILAGGQPGTALEAITKVLAAQRISENPDTGAMLTTLKRTAKLQRIVPAPNGRFLSSDGSRVAVTTDSGVQMVDTETGDAVGMTLGQPGDAVFGTSPGGRYLAAVGKNDELRVWDSVGGRQVGQPIHGRVRPSGVAVSPDGRRVAADDADLTVRLWDVESGRPIGDALPGRGGGSALAFSPDGHRLASSDGIGNTLLWDASTGAALGAPLPGNRGNITGIAFGPDNRTVATSESTILLADPAPPLWLRNADTGATIGTPLFANFGTILSMAFSPDGNRVATGGSDKAIRLWDAHTGQPIGDPLVLPDQVSEVAFTRDGRRIVAVSADTVQIYDADPYAVLLTPMGGNANLQSVELVNYWVLITAAGPRMLVVDNGKLKLLDADTGEQVGQAGVLDITDFMCDIVSPDSRWLVRCVADNAVGIFDTSNGQQYGKPLTGHQGTVHAAFSPDGQTLATASEDKTVRLWDWRNHRQIGEPIDGGEPIEKVEFSDDGHRLLTTGETEIRVWDTTTRTTIGKPFRFGSIMSEIAISPDGRRIAAAASETIQQWDVQTGDPLGPPLTGHTIGVSTLAFGPDGSYLVSAGKDATVRFWNTASGRQLGDPINIAADIGLLSVSHDGRRVFVTAPGASPREGQFTGIRISQLPAPPSWQGNLCDKLAGNPTEEQWNQWISPDVEYMDICPAES